MNKQVMVHDKTILQAQIKACEDLYIDFIRQRLGIVIHHQIIELNKTIVKACEKFNLTPHAYLNVLMTSSDDTPYMEHLIAGVTIGETYFFRDKRQMQLIDEYVLPQLIQNKSSDGSYSLRIWSAGCSSGEEIFTIAMMLYEKIPNIKKWNLQLLGTDINSKLMQKAMSGQYTDWSMRAISDKFKKNYFIKVGREYRLIKEVRDLVNFSYLNLNDDYYPSMFNGTNAQDLILCRNVLIYFDSLRITQLMQRLSASLIPSGFLMLGASDPIYIQNADLVLHGQKCSLYVRNDYQAETKIEKRLAESVQPKETTYKPEIIQKNRKPFAITQNKVKITKIDYPNIINTLLNESRWQEVLNAVRMSEGEAKTSAFLLNAKAIASANLGKLSDAIDACEKSILLEPTNKFTYFTYALALAESNRLVDAEAALRKTLFLDHQFVVGHFQLGLLLLRQNQKAAGLKCLQNALSIASLQNSHQIVPGANGLSYGRLTNILIAEIELYMESGNQNYVNEHS